MRHNPGNIKIIHVITRMDMGGSARNTLLTCLHSGSKDYTIYLVFGPTYESEMTASEKASVEKDLKRAMDKGVVVKQIPWLIRKPDPIKDVLALWALFKLFIREKPFIVHTHTSKAGLLGRLAAWMSRVPIIIHTPHGHVFYGHFSKWESRIYRVIETVATLITHRLVTISQGEKQDYLELGVCKSDKMVSICSGVDISEFVTAESDKQALIREIGIPDTSAIVGYVGWLIPVKGPEYLVRAMDQVWLQFPDTHLVLVGKGELESDLKHLAATTRYPEKIHFLGWRPDIPNLMALFDVLAVPSLNEGMGRVVVEAMAAGRPVVGSRVGGIQSIIEDGKTGFLVPPADPDQLAAGIRRILGDPELSRNMGRQARVHSHRFSIETMIRDLENLYLQMIHDYMQDNGMSPPIMPMKQDSINP